MKISDLLIPVLICAVIGLFVVASLIGGSYNANDAFRVSEYLENQGFQVTDREYRSSDFESDFFWSLPKRELRLDDFLREAENHNVNVIYRDYKNENDGKWVAFWFVAQSTKFELFENYIPETASTVAP